MSKLRFDITMSLDGFIAGPNPGPEAPLGEGGERLHQWVYHPNTRTPEVPTAGSFGQMVERWIEAIDSGGWYWDRVKRRWQVNSDLLDPELEATGLV